MNDKVDTFSFGKMAQRGLSVALTIAAVISIGFLSFAGFYLLIPSVLLASISMALASMIEFTVIYENISGAFTKLFQQDHLQDVLVERLLRDLIRKRAADECSEQLAYINDYIAQRDYVHQLKFHHATSPEHKQKLAHEERTLQQMIGVFRRYLFSTGTIQPRYEHQFTQLITTEQQKAFLASYRRKYRLSSFVIIPVMIAAVSCGFVTYTTISLSLVELLPALQSMLPGLAGVSLISLTPLVAALATVASVAYFMQILNSACDIIYKDSFQHLWADIRQGVTAGKGGAFLYGLGVVGLVGLSLFVNVATAATWWAGVAGMPFAYPNMLSVLFYASAQMAFNLENTHRTLEQLNKLSIRGTFKWMLKKLRSTIAKEHWLQLLNPFRVVLRLIKVPFRVVSFLGHVFSIGVTTDNFWNRWFSAFAASIGEVFEDLHYVMHVDGHHHGHKGAHGHADGHDDDGHHHVDIVGWVFTGVAFFPLILPSILCDWGASQFNADPKRRLSFEHAWARAFGGVLKDHPESPKPLLSEVWLAEERDLARSAVPSDQFASEPMSYPSQYEGEGKSDLAAFLQQTSASVLGGPRFFDKRFGQHNGAEPVLVQGRGLK